MEDITVRAAMNSKVKIIFDQKVGYRDEEDAVGIFKFLISVIPSTTFDLLMELLKYWKNYKDTRSSDEIIQKWKYDKWDKEDE